MFVPLAIDQLSTRLADWLELNAILSEYGEVPVEQVWEAADISDDAYSDDSEEDAEKESLIARTTKEIELRVGDLKIAYPFELINGSKQLKVKADLTPGAIAYLLCLRLSLVDTSILVDGVLPDPTQEERRLFQYVSSISAAGYLKGKSYSFGYPRPDETTLLEALGFLEAEMAEGKVRTSPAEGAPEHPNDDEVDVIAWIPQNDGPGWALTMWGQVASGKNWIGKPLTSQKVDQFRVRWYLLPPAVHPILAMFIPFCVHESARSDSLKRYREKLIDSCRHHGTLFHRFRIPFYVESAYAVGSEVDGIGPINKGSLKQLLDDWWAVFRNQLTQAHAA